MAESFKSQLGRLEEITRLLENGECELEEAIKLFEEGVAISGKCNKTLNEASQKINFLEENE